MRHLLLALLALTACDGGDSDDKAPADDTTDDTESPADPTTDSDDAADTDTTADSDTTTPDETNEPAGVARLRFFGRDYNNVPDRVAFTARLDGEPISEDFDAGVLGSATGWVYPGDDAVEVTAGAHTLTLDVTQYVPSCPECPPTERSASVELDVDLTADQELLVLFEAANMGRNGGYNIHATIWTADDTRTRAGNGGVRVIGYQAASPAALVTTETNLYAAYDGCILPGATLYLQEATRVMPVPASDTAEAWLGIENINPFGPSYTSWYRLPDRPAGEVLPVLASGPSVLPDEEGPAIPLVAAELGWSNCPPGPS